ncbi:MAG TPA: hypothetical protein VGJ23_01700 [Gaiellaceae bacterium]|jgi:hypothetical protein
MSSLQNPSPSHIPAGDWPQSVVERHHREVIRVARPSQISEAPPEVVVVDEVVLLLVVVLAVELDVLETLLKDSAGAITDVGSEVATVEPFLFVAVTTTRNVNPTSAAMSM